MLTETTAIVCAHVFREERPVRVVIHHDDGVWQLVCGGADHPADCGDFETVGLQHLLDRQADLGAVAGLQKGWMAELNAEEAWEYMPFDE